MSNRVQYFSDLLSDESELFRRYLVRRKLWKDGPVFIFEGDDEKYYSAVITSYLTGTWHAFIAGRREDVLELRGDIRGNKQLADDNCYFLVDHDYVNTATPSSDLYVTPPHSIENLYCSANAVRAMIRGESGLSRADKEELENEILLEWILKIYTEGRQQYLQSEAVRKFNLLLSVYSGLNLTDKLNLNDNVEMNTELSISGQGTITVRTDFSAKKVLSNVLDKYVRKNLKGILSSRGFVRQYYDRSICRGKQDIFFLYKFLCSVNNGEIADYIKNKFGRKVRIIFAGDESSLLSFGAQYADKPSCLKTFIRRISDTRINAQSHRV